MAKKDGKIEAEAATLRECRERILVEIPASCEVFEEEIVKDGASSSVTHRAASIEEARNEIAKGLPAGATILTEKLKVKPQERAIVVHARNADQARAKVQSQLKDLECVCDVTLHVPGRSRLWGFWRTMDEYSITVRRKAVVEIEYGTEAHLIVHTTGRSGKTFQLWCLECGHIQRYREWEKLMEAKVRALTGTRWFNLSARAQCLSCGRRELENVWASRRDRMRAVNESRKQRKARETPEYQALTALFRRGSVPNSTSSWERKRAKVTEIGRDVAKKGGKRLLSLVSSALPDGTREEASWKEFAYEAWHELYYD